MNGITVHLDPHSPGTLYLQDSEDARFYLTRYDARRLVVTLLAMTEPADDDPMRWITRFERNSAGAITMTPPPPNGWPARAPGTELREDEL